MFFGFPLGFSSFDPPLVLPWSSLGPPLGLPWPSLGPPFNFPWVLRFVFFSFPLGFPSFGPPLDLPWVSLGPNQGVDQVCDQGGDEELGGGGLEHYLYNKSIESQVPAEIIMSPD